MTSTIIEFSATTTDWLGQRFDVVEVLLMVIIAILLLDLIRRLFMTNRH